MSELTNWKNDVSVILKPKNDLPEYWDGQLFISDRGTVFMLVDVSLAASAIARPSWICICLGGNSYPEYTHTAGHWSGVCQDPSEASKGLTPLGRCKITIEQL